MGKASLAEQLLEELRAGRLDTAKKHAIASGMLPIPAQELLPLVIELSNEDDELLADSAHETLLELPSPIVEAYAADPHTPALHVERLAALCRARPQVLRSIASNRSAPDHVILDLASSRSKEVLEVLVANEDRLVRKPAIIDALLKNSLLAPEQARRLDVLREEQSQWGSSRPGSSSSSRSGRKLSADIRVAAATIVQQSDKISSIDREIDRVRQDMELDALLEESSSSIALSDDTLLLREGDLFAGPLGESSDELSVDLPDELPDELPDTLSISPTEIEDEKAEGSSLDLLSGLAARWGATADPSIEVSFSASAPQVTVETSRGRVSPSSSASGDAPREAPPEGGAFGGADLETRIRSMPTGDRITLAMKGKRKERAVLITDSDLEVALAVLRNPKITDSEAESLAALRAVRPEVLAAMAREGRWLRRPIFVYNLVQNPQTPLDVSMPLLKRLYDRDLRNVQRRRDLPEPLRKAAGHILEQRSGGA